MKTKKHANVKYYTYKITYTNAHIHTDIQI